MSKSPSVTTEKIIFSVEKWYGVTSPLASSSQRKTKDTNGISKLEKKNQQAMP